MDLKYLNTFIQVAELKSFTKAADKLGCTQSTVSFQIKQLESELGVPLFERINRTVVLTPEGSMLLKSAHRIDSILCDFTNELKQEKVVSGHVRLAMADSLCNLLIGRIYPKLQKEYPEITLEIIASDTEGMFSLLNHNEVDLVCTLDSHIYDANYKILHEKPIHLHFVGAPNHTLGSDSLLPEALTQLPFLLTEKGMSYRKQLDEALASRSLAIHPHLVSGNADLLCDLVAKGCGYSFLPDYITWPYVEAGTMVYLPVDKLRFDIWTQLLGHREKWITSSMRVVIDMLIAELNSIL